MLPNNSTSNSNFLLTIIFLLSAFATFSTSDEKYCYSDSQCNRNLTSNTRYILYDVNPPEGFNLRRDVYMRFAILANKLQKSKHEQLKHFKLVLPPWSRLYHWTTYSSAPEHLPWGLFFDLDSLQSFAPVIEMHEFFTTLNKTYSVSIDEVYILQHFKDMFETGNFEERMKIEECQVKYNLDFFFYKNMTARKINCLSYHGPATKLSQLLIRNEAKIILFHHAEVALHDTFGDKLYWQCRRSMRFNKNLKQIAANFRRDFLNSTDEEDNTVLPDDWRMEKHHRTAQGGPYLAVHIRRRDFLRGRAHQLPDIDSLAQQIAEMLEKLKLKKVFIATDASEKEYADLISRIASDFEAYKYVANDEIKAKYKEGGVAIIEQIICSYARYFIGTYESTFSFRIQEEREILGFPVKTTFNSFCKDQTECLKPSVWKIVY